MQPVRPGCRSGGAAGNTSTARWSTPDRRDRQHSLTKPPVRRLRVDALNTRPLSQITHQQLARTCAFTIAH
jgi:hypothetical protein